MSATSISLKINIVKHGSVKTMKFQSDMTIQDVCKDIRVKLGESGGTSDHGLFWPEQGKWLEVGRTLDFYDLKSQDLLEYRKKHRPLKVMMLDNAVKTILVDDSFTVFQLVNTVCSRIGIQNPEEYSFTTADSVAAEHIKNTKGKIKRTKSQEKLGADAGWLNPDKSLREQGIDENEVLVLKKKFFFNDQNIDRTDPIQLNLLYVQSQEAIIKGTHPCTLEESAQFAALQCQVQFGNHETDKHKPGFLNLAEFVPPEYLNKKKTAEVERKIFQEHRKLQGMAELNAKFRYVQLCRSLKTYGVTFYNVKEKVPKKNKFIKILLGVTRDSILRVDAETKEVIKVWKLTNLRRWAASPNSFTLDFGDYADGYYSVQTAEGESISQLIAGYIDIILKKKSNVRQVGQDSDQDLVIVEENIQAAQGTKIDTMQLKQGVAEEVVVPNSGMVGSSAAQNISKSSLSPNQMQYVDTSSPMSYMSGQHTPILTGGSGGPSGAQQAVLQNINNGFASVNAAQSDLNVATTLPPLGNDPTSLQWKKQTMDINKQNVNSQVAAHLAATAALVNLTSVDPAVMDYAAIGSNVSTLTNNLGQLATGTKMVAALMDDPNKSDDLIKAAKDMAGSTSDLLSKAQPAITGEGNRQDLLGAAQGIGAASSQLLKNMGENEVSPAAQQQLIQLAQDVVAAMTDTIQKGKTVSGKCADPQMQNQVNNALKVAAGNAKQLVTTANVVAPSINSPICQQELVQSANNVEGAINNLVQRAKQGCTDQGSIKDLLASADKVKDALSKLTENAKQGGDSSSEMSEMERNAEKVSAQSSLLMDALGDSVGTIKSAKGLAVSTTALINSLKQQAANEKDVNEKARLLAAAKNLADATTRMVNAAKESARNPNDPAVQARLKAAAEELANTAKSSTGSADDRKKTFKKLMMMAKANAQASTQLISAAKACGPSNRNQASQMQLIQACKGVAENTTPLVMAVRALNENPDDSHAQLKLMNAAKNSLNPGQSIVVAAKAAAPTVGDSASQGQLLNFAKSTNDSLKKLKDAVESAEAVSGGLELDSAMDSVKAAKKDLSDAKALAKAGKLKPAADQTADSCQMEIGATAKTLGSSMAQLISACSQGNEAYTGVAARDTATALANLGQAIKGVAATTSDRDLQDQILDCGDLVLGNCQDLINTTKAAVDDPANDDIQEKLVANAQAVNKSMAKLMDSLPGQRDIALAIANMNSQMSGLEANSVAEPGETFQSTQNKLATSGAALSVASNQLVTAAKGTPQQLKDAVKALESQFGGLVQSSQGFMAQSNDPNQKAEVLQMVNDVHASMSKLLQSSKAYQADPNGPNLKNLLALAAKGVADSIGKLMNVCSSEAPGTSECNEAAQTLNITQSKLDNVNDGGENDDSYFDSVNKIAEAQKQLDAALTSIPALAKAKDSAKIGAQVNDIAKAIDDVTAANVRAAYLVGVADPQSVSSVPGIVDQEKVSQSVNDITDATKKLEDPNNKNREILEAASIIAKNTAALCNTCKAASAKTANPVAKNQFIASAKEVAKTTADLVTNIKALAKNPNPETRQKCSDSSKPLVDSIHNLATFAASPEFAATQAYISPEAQKYQKPLVNNNKKIIDAGQQITETAKSLCANPDDDSLLNFLENQAKGLSDALKSLQQSAKLNAPGQKECSQAIDRLTGAIGELDTAAVQANAGTLTAIEGPDFDGFKDQLLNNTRAAESSIAIVADASTSDPLELAQSVEQLLDNLIPLCNSAIGTASKAEDKRMQQQLFDATKEIGEAGVELLYAAKAIGGNPKQQDPASLEKLNQAQANMKNSIQGLLSNLEGSSAETGEMNEVIGDIQASVATLDQIPDPEEFGDDLNYQNFAEDLLQAGKDFNALMSDIVSKSKDAEELGAMSGVVGERYGRMVRSARGAAASTEDEDVKSGVLESVKAIGGSGVRLLDAMKAVARNPNDIAARSKVSQAARMVAAEVATAMKSTRDGQKGLQVCQEAIVSIDDAIGDLDTAIVFAQAGQLDPIRKGDTFGNYATDLLQYTKDLTENIKGLNSGATAGQDQLAMAASNSVSTMNTLKDAIRNAAAAISSGDRTGQDQLLNAAKDVGVKLQSHIDACMKATSKRPADIENLKDSSKEMVKNIADLLKIVKTVSDENTRAVRAIDGTLEGIQEAIDLLHSEEPAQGTATPDEVIAGAKQVASSAAQLVTASNNNNQDEIITAVGTARKNVENLLRAGKASTAEAPEEAREKMHDACDNSAEKMKDLLQASKTLQESNNPQNKLQVQKCAKGVAESVGLIVQACGTLVPGGYVDPNDPNVIAERELLAAAGAIEAAAKKLANLQAPQKPKDIDEDLNFEEQILEAAKAIAGATAALVRSATAAQREILAKGKSGGEDEKKYFSDGTWSDGLVSAAKAVALSTGDLCESANNAVQGKGEREAVIVSARQVSASTQQLLSAASVSTDSNSESQGRLRAAGKTVQKATTALVDAAESTLVFEDADQIALDAIKGGGIKSHKAEMEQQMEILRIEKQLESARMRLGGIRKAKYAMSENK